MLLEKYIRHYLYEKKFSELPNYKKNKALNVYDDLLSYENDGLRDEVFDLIDKTYSYLGNKDNKGSNAIFSSPDDLMNPKYNDYEDFIAWDIDEDLLPDVISGSKLKSGKKKLSIGATDGSKSAIEFLKSNMINKLTKEDYWCEASGRVAAVLMKASIPAITDSTIALNMINKSDIVWHGEHPYFKDPKKYGSNWHEGSLEIEAKKSKSLAKKQGEYDGWYERKIGKKQVVKIAFG